MNTKPRGNIHIRSILGGFLLVFSLVFLFSKLIGLFHLETNGWLSITLSVLSILLGTFIPAKWIRGTAFDGAIAALFFSWISMLVFQFQLVKSIISLGIPSFLILIFLSPLLFVLIGFLGGALGVKFRKCKQTIITV